ncbi:DUF305 domain-containing protein [Acrocarpospora catenulata]|uniref:DUF305 domain-containing protein n=1 Tax=Acrocarpospora catenulata TaxID=2836182 RepID=UPI001BD91BAF|nr:DUF305 domain-containing protein [Acrocarpospora catenulata]
MRWIVVGAVLVLVTGCSAAAVPPPAPSAAVSSYNATDVAWLQLLIPMTEQAVRLFDTVPERTGNPQVVEVARVMRGDHQSQLERLRELLRRSGNAETDIHDGHDLPGMVTPDDLVILGKVKERAFDRLFAVHVSEYLRQSVLVADGEQNSGADPDTKEFAASMARSRQDELGKLPRSDPS